MSYGDYFKGKKVTLMGLGVLGRGLGDAIYLAESGVDLIVTDLKSEEELRDSVDQLRNYRNVSLHLGGHDFADFENRDFILKAAGVPLDSPYIAHARKNNVKIEMSASLFLKLTKLFSIGITGTRGKSTVTHLIYHTLKNAGRNFLLGGNILGVSNLQLLNKVEGKEGIVLELDSWQLQGFGEDMLYPNIAVFTTFLPDHMNYYGGSMERYFRDKAYIYEFQREKDILVAGQEVSLMIKQSGIQQLGRMVVPKKTLPDGFKINLLGSHNEFNASLALAALREYGLSDREIKEGFASFKGVPGRLEAIRLLKGVIYINDTTATTPDATLAALHAFREYKKQIILIMGGSDKGLDMKDLMAEIPKYVKSVYFLEGTGTTRIEPYTRDWKNINRGTYNGLTYALFDACAEAESGDIVLMSPAFASFGMFKNEFDRGEQFNSVVNALA